MTTRFEETVTLMERDGAHGYAQYLRDLKASHEALLKAAKASLPDVTFGRIALVEAIRAAEELSK